MNQQGGTRRGTRILYFPASVVRNLYSERRRFKRQTTEALRFTIRSIRKLSLTNTEVQNCPLEGDFPLKIEGFPFHQVSESECKPMSIGRIFNLHTYLAASSNVAAALPCQTHQTPFAPYTGCGTFGELKFPHRCTPPSASRASAGRQSDTDTSGGSTTSGRRRAWVAGEEMGEGDGKSCLIGGFLMCCLIRGKNMMGLLAALAGD